MSTVESSNKVGRPFKFTDPVQLKAMIDQYFDMCDPHTEMRKVENGTNSKGETIWITREVMTEQKPYTTTGLALALDTTRQTLLEYTDPAHYSDEISEETRDNLIDTITRAKHRVMQFAEQFLFSGKQANGAIFNLKNNHGWEDTKKVENTNRNVTGDLDELDNQKDAVAKAAKEKLADDNKDPGPEAQQQVVAPNAIVQDPK